MKIDFEKAGGLIPAIAQDAATGTVLMMAWMNQEAYQETLRTGRAVYFSRSRNKLWRKGEESGNVQLVKAIYADCDADTLLLRVEPSGPACHTGAASCFAPIAAIPAGEAPAASADPFGLGPLVDVVAARKERPEPGSYTNRLLEKGVGKCAQKVGEEGVEVALAAVSRDDAGLAAEIADLMYHVVVLMAARGLSPEAVAAELAARRGKRREEK